MAYKIYRHPETGDIKQVDPFDDIQVAAVKRRGYELITALKPTPAPVSIAEPDIDSPGLTTTSTASPDIEVDIQESPPASSPTPRRVITTKKSRR